MCENIPQFNLIAMKSLVDKDRYFSFVFNDLMKKGLEEENALQVIFNSNILGDAAMEDIYLQEINQLQ
ncbi:hypothetical protein NC797_07610 [Aquibacillus sp. 3ASR75-11]|uniref:Uncharacterized protein n=1 Tax=Terrihalobacillus insolitus TaxID=2950438 RepID=A0A9X4ALG8_9BACI|nr:hypothetical protein [Terrihalobacillus insolitus]MDC3424372.1 hypothetical protein [Terrihalobacillus insolitus]